jgi:hypothetical protein
MGVVIGATKPREREMMAVEEPLGIRRRRYQVIQKYYVKANQFDASQRIKESP